MEGSIKTANVFHFDMAGKKEELEIGGIENDIANDKWQKWEKPMKVKQKELFSWDIKWEI